MAKLDNLPEDFEASSHIRTAGRELALRLLYLLDMRGKETADSQINFVLTSEQVKHQSQNFARTLYEGTRDNLAELDAKIAETAVNWDISRMAYIDKAILRMGIYELLHCPDIPPKVTISEALELAKKYSTDKSSSFINGILDAIYQANCPNKA